MTDVVKNQNPSVLQDWVLELPIMQQTVLIECVRGPDTMPKYHVSKFLLRWYRRCILVSAFDRGIIPNPYYPGGGSFTGPACSPPEAFTPPKSWQVQMDDVVSEYLRAIDEIPHHFTLHIMHASEILGYKHPDPFIEKWWHHTYIRLAHDMHLWPETREQLNRRLGDTQEGWEERADPATRA